jgi:hypothetical protein
MVIPHVDMKEERRIELQNQVAKANNIFKNYYNRVVTNKGRNGFVTSDNKKLSRIDFFNEIVMDYNKNKTSNVFLHGIIISNEDAALISRVKEVEWEILSSMSNMFCKIINSKLLRSRDIAISFEDLESEAIKCVLSALCSYSDSSVCFSTYFYNCVSRHVGGYCSRSNPMSKLSKKAIELKKRFVEEKKKFPNLNLDELISSMNMASKDSELLRSALNCYFVDSKEIQNKQDHRIDNNLFLSLDSMDLNSIEMTELEKAVLEGVMHNSGANLGLNSIVKSIINPKTGKPYTRMAASLAWKKVKEKIKTKYRGAA